MAGPEVTPGCPHCRDRHAGWLRLQMWCVCAWGGGASPCVCVLVRQACIIMPHEEGDRPTLSFSP